MSSGWSFPPETAVEIARSAGAAPKPFLLDEGVRRRAIEIARRQGLWDELEAELSCSEPIQTLPYSKFRLYRRKGIRAEYDPLMGARILQMERAAMACYLGMDAGSRLDDLLWAQCESTWWILPSHERSANGPLDLTSCFLGAWLSTIVNVLGERLSEEVVERVRREVQSRILSVFMEPGRRFWWQDTKNNWNAVCHAGVGIAAMNMVRDPAALEAIFRKIMAKLPSYIDGFTDDGGCTEGPGYWKYGFNIYLDLAATVFDFTGGKVNLMAGEKIERICRYPLAVAIRPRQDLNFADAASGYIPLSAAIRVNRFYPVPELLGLCQPAEDGSPAVATLDELAMYDGRPTAPWQDRSDSYLERLGVVKYRRGKITLGAKAGHNAESHNHNDVGSFLVHRGGTFFLTDPGGPKYSARTFGPRRYESVFCNSLGHSVPVVNGLQQSHGRLHEGTLTVSGLNSEGDKSAVMDMTRAYKDTTLQRLARRLVLSGEKEQILLADTLEFSAMPTSLEEAFITTQPAQASEDGRSVRITSQDDGSAVIACTNVAGRFAVAELTEESRQESRNGALLRRITFWPDALERNMTLEFLIQWE